MLQNKTKHISQQDALTKKQAQLVTMLAVSTSSKSKHDWIGDKPLLNQEVLCQCRSFECRSYVTLGLLSVGLLSVGLLSVGLLSVGLLKQHLFFLCTAIALKLLTRVLNFNQFLNKRLF